MQIWTRQREKHGQVGEEMCVPCRTNPRCRPSLPAMGVSNNITACLKFNFLAVLWFASKQGVECARLERWPVAILGGLLPVLVVFVSSSSPSPSPTARGRTQCPGARTATTA